jgi:hypothetical protein
MTEAQLKEICKNLTAAADGLLASMSAKATRTITYLPSCPKPFQASCDKAIGMPFAAFYYKHSAKDLATAKQGCTAGRGGWTTGGLK